MSVLVEAISVIIRGDRLTEMYPGGWEAFRASRTSATLCADGELVRVGFMTPGDTLDYIVELEKYGLVYQGPDGHAQDVVVVDQQRGPATPCDWIEFFRIPHKELPNKSVAACQLKGGVAPELVIPPGWVFEESLSNNFDFTPTERVIDDLVYLRTEDGVEVYRNLKTGKEVYIGRPRR